MNKSKELVCITAWAVLSFELKLAESSQVIDKKSLNFNGTSK
jgi:hypothetical protein